MVITLSVGAAASARVGLLAQPLLDAVGKPLSTPPAINSSCSASGILEITALSSSARQAKMKSTP